MDEIYIALDKKNIRGIFNNESLISKKNDCYIIKYEIKSKSICNNDVLYVFFQYIYDDFKNIKIFSELEDATEYRDKKFCYGHILGLKKDKYYSNLMGVEYISVKELN